MDISVVVPTFNRRELVTRTLRTLFAQRVETASYEVIVVVDGSIDGTAAALRSLKSSCPFRVIEQENRGLAAARNTGFRAAAANLVLFLDDDMLCDPGLVHAHLAAHVGNARGVAFGAIFLSDDSPQSLAAECFKREIGATYLAKQRNPDSIWRDSHCVFGNASLSRELLDESGGFDEAFRMREDFELGTRLWRAGARRLYAGNAIAYQYYAKTSADLIKNAEEFAVADVMFAHKHPDVQGHLDWGTGGAGWKRNLRRIAATWPKATDFVLAPLCFLGTTFLNVELFRNLGIRALQLRRGIHWLNEVQELQKRRP